MLLTIKVKINTMQNVPFLLFKEEILFFQVNSRLNQNYQAFHQEILFLTQKLYRGKWNDYKSIIVVEYGKKITNELCFVVEYAMYLV